MTVSYFGENSDGTGDGVLSGYSLVNNNAVTSFVCPGTGTQDVKELGIRARDVSVGSDHVRVALYNTDGSFVCQGSAEITVSANTHAWYTHTSFVDAAGSAISPQITGGTAYLIAVTADGANIYIAANGTRTNNNKYSSNDYTGGFPSSYTPSTTSTPICCCRCGVEPAAGGGVSVTPQLMMMGMG